MEFTHAPAPACPPNAMTMCHTGHAAICYGMEDYSECPLCLALRKLASCERMLTDKSLAQRYTGGTHANY